MDNVAQLALEDAYGLFLGVPVSASLVEDGLSSRLAAELGHRHPMQDRVDAPVATSVERVPDGSSSPSAEEAGRGCGAVEAAKPQPVNRRGSRTSTSGSAVERVEMPQSWSSVEPICVTSLPISQQISS